MRSTPHRPTRTLVRHSQHPKEPMSTDLSPPAESFLEKQPNLVLGTIRKDGSPQASPVWYLWTGSSFLISTVDTAAKWKNLQRDPRCSVCVDDPATGQMIVAYGKTELTTESVEDQTRVLQVLPGRAGANRGPHETDLRRHVDESPHRRHPQRDHHPMARLTTIHTLREEGRRSRVTTSLPELGDEILSFTASPTADAP